MHVNRFTLKQFGPSGYFFLFLGFLWAGVSLFTYLQYGVKTSADTPFYLEGAQSILKGELLEGRAWYYSAYMLFLAILLKAGLSLGAIVAVQYLLNGLSVYFLYKSCFAISKSALAAGFSSLAYILWIKIHLWNSFIYTESLFVSFLIFSLYALLKSRQSRRILYALPLLIFTGLIRPNGIGLLFALLSFALMEFPWQRFLPARWPRYGLATSTGIAALLILNYMLKDYAIVESFARSELIYPNQSLGFYPEKPLQLPDASLPPLIKPIVLAYYNPGYFFTFNSTKLVLFLTQVRPYFSFPHNLWLLTTLLPLYGLAIAGFRHFPDKAVGAYLLTFVGFQCIAIFLSTLNWDGRFLVPILPYVFIGSGLGFARLWKRYRKRSDRKS